MPFIKAKNGNVVEIADDLVAEFVAQGHKGPFDTEAEAFDADADEPPVTPEPEPAEDPATGTPAVLEEPKANGSKADWLAYAAGLGVEVADGASRDDIRAAVAEALAEVDDPDE